ncbi:ABC1 kinase family protein [Polycladidibacter hongkongensis]|uniref:ABC1 kinase family protein n=1 Tax=Polycladidibacter hongkongensis TaxID=1647556 RepID=UPI00082B17B0|nr:AarF/UbiB family protein [Pseudovibrio hongkongensis]
MAEEKDDERNRFSARLGRYARTGGNLGGIAAKMAGAKLFGLDINSAKNASELAEALGGLKGPLMKVAQMLATIPDAVPPEYAAELAALQADAPPMGWAFVKRRMRAELGANWQSKFAEFDHEPSAAASLGQVHKARLEDGTRLACKLQYPDMDSAVAADLAQMRLALSIHKRIQNVVDTSEIGEEIAARLYEELDYSREARNMSAYTEIFTQDSEINVPQLNEGLSTRRLLSMGWLEGARLLSFKDASQDVRNDISRIMFKAWWMPFSRYGVIHGDPHLGNYTIAGREVGELQVNLLDYGCIRIFDCAFVEGVTQLYYGLLHGDETQVVAAYEAWGFEHLDKELIEILNVWARFIYGPLLTDRVRALAEGVSAAAYGRQEAFKVHQALKAKGPLKIPRSFVFMDRAAIGLGGVFLHMRAELNFYQLFNDLLEGFDVAKLAQRQANLLAAAGLDDHG